MEPKEYKLFGTRSFRESKGLKPKKASKIVTKKMLKDSGFDNLRDFMNTFKYDEDKGYVKRVRALKRKEDPKPVTKASGRERNQTTDIGKNILGKDVKGGQSAGLAGSPSGEAAGKKPVRKTSGRERNQTTDIGKNILAKDVKGGQSAGLAGSPSGRVKKNKGNNMKAGGPVKAKKKTTRKFRGDGIARKGKTKGRFV
jgi:hypothetical protein